jgi:hypothetical protein
MKKYLPPLEVCCEECHKITIAPHSNITLHFMTTCPIHGSKYIPSPFKKSLMDYEIKVSDELRTFDKSERRQYAKDNPGLFRKED